MQVEVQGQGAVVIQVVSPHKHLGTRAALLGAQLVARGKSANGAKRTEVAGINPQESK